jgi:DNA-binding SARP family transcriptional activator
MGMHLRADETGPLDEDFELTDEFLDQIPDAMVDWIQHPRYTFRPELIEWLKDTPPYDAYV